MREESQRLTPLHPEPLTLDPIYMIEIIPAILPTTFSDLKEKLSLVVGAAPLVQIDICDGSFVPSCTWPYAKPDENFLKIQREEEGMPYWEDLEFEIDLMVSGPELKVTEWIAAGAKRIVIHYESVKNFEQFLEDFEPTFGKLTGLPFPVELGLAINIETSPEEIFPYLRNIDFVQCMGIKKIGYQGQKFDEAVLEKIRTLKNVYPEGIISVDGGVNFETAPYLVEAGATRLISGSALFADENVGGNIEEMKALLEDFE